MSRVIHVLTVTLPVHAAHPVTAITAQGITCLKEREICEIKVDNMLKMTVTGGEI